MGKGKKEEKKEREGCMLKNGGLLLEKRISYFGGRYSNPLRNFSIQEIQRATDNFNGNLIFNHDAGYYYKWDKGSLEGRVICIRTIFPSFPGRVETVINEIAVATQMSSHKNVLKLLGSCLETRIPILVYEFSSCELLEKKIFDCNEPFPWKSGLKIAYEIASAIAYLHTAFPRPIIHRDIKPPHFFLDNGSTPKLSNFGFSIALPEGETHVKDDPCGTFGYMAPEVFPSGMYTEKTDVFSFGTLILELLTRRRASFIAQMEGVSMRKYVEDHIENYGINDILDPIILVEGGGVFEQQQFQAVYQLALKCTEEFAEERPTIVDAAKEIRRIQRLVVI